MSELKAAADCTPLECCEILEAQCPKAGPQPVGHVTVDFPKELPLHSVGHLIAMFRGAEPRSIPDVLQHAGVILGCAGKLMESGQPMPIGAGLQDKFLDYILKIVLDMLQDK